MMMDVSKTYCLWSVTLVICGCFRVVTSVLEHSDTVLRIGPQTLVEDLVILRSLTAAAAAGASLEEGCRLKELHSTLYRFHLTTQDVELLQGCPLKVLHLTGSSCFPSSARIDLSVFTGLEELHLGHCWNDTFVVTGLPDTLRVLDVRGLTEKNFELSADRGDRFGASIERLNVNKASMCCPGVLYGRGLPKVVCKYHSLLYDVLFRKPVQCGLSDDGTRLFIASKDDIPFLRHQFRSGKCNVSDVFIDLPEYTMTREDIASLQTCPLKVLTLQDSRCFSPDAGDLSGLTRLNRLNVQFCRSHEFVITKLPASMTWLDIQGLAEFNVRLVDEYGGAGNNSSSGGGFGESFVRLQLYSPAMCCNNTLYTMFSRDMRHVCEDNQYRKCGVSYGFDGVHLSVDSRHQLHAQLPEKSCALKRLNAVGPDFFLTQTDIDALSGCSIKSLFLPYTACFSGFIDLSSLSGLETLSIPHCSQLDFTITGLPLGLVNLDIRGLHIENIQLSSPETSFGSSLRQLEVSNPTTCQCPQAVNHMFLKPLSENTTCGLTDITFSAINVKGIMHQVDYSGGFQSDGFDSAIASCEFLIEDPVLRVLLWVMAILATGGNISVLIYRLVWDRKSFKKSHGIYPLHLAVSDLLMGVYLFIIADAESTFRGEYVLYDDQWRWGPLCHLAGFLSTISSEVSAIIILLITIDRWLVIQFPFGQYRLSLRHSWLLCCSTWVIGVLLAALPLIITDWEVYHFNSICVGLPLNKDHYSGSGYATGMFIGVNSALFLMIAVGQASIYRAHCAKSKKAVFSEKQAKRRYKRDLAIARQLSLIVITDFLCWFPICVMGLMAQHGHLIPNSAYAWSAVVVMPINSSINPLLYTLRNVFSDSINKCLRRCRRAGGKTVDKVPPQ